MMEIGENLKTVIVILLLAIVSSISVLSAKQPNKLEKETIIKVNTFDDEIVDTISIKIYKLDENGKRINP